MADKIIADAPPAAAWWHKKTVSERIDEMKLHRRLVIKRLKRSGVWSKDEIRDIAWIITKKIRAWEKLRGVNLHYYDIAKWLRER